MSSMTITFAWWNVGLKPPIATAKDPEAAAMLRPWFGFCHLNELIGLDLMAFGEVSNSFTLLANQPFSELGFNSLNITHREGRIIHDIAVFYRTSKFNIIESKSIIHPHYSGNLKVAIRIIFSCTASGEIFYIYISHWPSKMSRPEIGRDELGYALRSDINTIFEEHGYDAKIILMGDYNNEPFEAPIYDKLIATRDRTVVKNKPFILYNPFWRVLGGLKPYSKEENISPCHGTYHYKSSPHVTKWFTFDQIIVSSAFMGHSEWHLDEKRTTVFNYQEDTYLNKTFFKDFDHLPIFGRVIKNDHRL